MMHIEYVISFLHIYEKPNKAKNKMIWSVTAEGFASLVIDINSNIFKFAYVRELQCLSNKIAANNVLSQTNLQMHIRKTSMLDESVIMFPHFYDKSKTK